MIRLPVALLVALTLLGCHGETSRPEASGKGAIRAINAIATSPEIAFLIEERLLGNVNYKNNSAPASWDDISYTFSFDAVLAGDLAGTRIARQPLEVVADMEYTMVILGDLTAPSIATWEIPQREFGDGSSVFELRIGHASASMGTVDIYFAPDGVTPVLGEQIARLAPGEVTTSADYDSAAHVLTVTTAGDPGDVLFRTAPSTFAAAQSFLITLFDGDGNDPSPFFARSFNQIGLGTSLPDDRVLPTARYIHGTTDLATSDIYDDAALTNRVFTGLAFGDATGHIDTPVGDIPISFTAVDNVGSILFETTLTSTRGTRLNVYMTRSDQGLIGQRIIVDRRSVETFAKLSFFHSAANHGSVDLYIVESGESIDEARPARVGLDPGLPSDTIAIAAGDYDLYVTTAGEKSVLDGPVPFTASLGAVSEGILIDRTDPNLAEFRILPPP
jgi:hypothetical protein